MKINLKQIKFKKGYQITELEAWVYFENSPLYDNFFILFAENHRRISTHIGFGAARIRRNGRYRICAATIVKELIYYVR